MKEIALRKPMKDWSIDEQPREKLQNQGRKSLTNSELLAIVLRSGTPKQSALDIARTILDSVDNDLHRLARKTIDDLMKFPGVGKAKATEILAVMELVRRRQQSKLRDKAMIKCSADAFQLIAPVFMDLDHEEFYALYLSRGNKVLQIKQISQGGISGTVADGKVIFNYGLETKASGIILAHNHPSGNSSPSVADIQLTSSLKKFGEYIDVQILDHIIVAGNNYFSFADEGRI
ncbi:MAG: DNA repair protein RadC [bacterium]|nr:DNA repair protein RadC [bacterium]